MEWAKTLIVSSTMGNGTLPAYKRARMAAAIERIGAEAIAGKANERDGVALPTTWNNIIWLKSPIRLRVHRSVGSGRSHRCVGRVVVRDGRRGG